ncbi:hypothetical protein K0M31_008720 [Melipona bicolor]|uniref:BTB domain-containing protein n=1 Tax=Melipona bicolor TaxID=60889 RepID=A0AA40FPP6_9HYME|nr:hypothetical protein K0M31_008720 [Melipona bicolor]
MMGEVIRVSGRAPNVGEFLKEAMLSQRFADVALCCPGGQRFLAHRLVLSAASPYLQVGALFFFFCECNRYFHIRENIFTVMSQEKC